MKGRAGSQCCALLLGALLPLATSALTYTENLDDDPELSITLRLDRQGLRMDKLESLAQQIRLAGESIADTIMIEGKPLQAAIEAKLKTFNEARDTTTVKTAQGGDGSRGLRWYCERAVKLGPQLSGLASAVGGHAQHYQTAFKVAAPGSEGSAAALEAAIDELQGGLEAALEKIPPDPTRAHLQELAQSLPHSFGTYTSLRGMAGEIEMQTRQLNVLADRLDQATRDLDTPVSTYVRQRELAQSVLRVLDKENLDAAGRQRLTDLQRRFEALRTGPLKRGAAQEHADNAKWWRDSWRARSRQVSGEVFAATRALREAAQLCGDDEAPAAKFEQTLAAAARTVRRDADAIENLGSARASAADTERRKLAQALATWQQVFQQAEEKSSVVWRRMETLPEGAKERVQLRTQFDRLLGRKKEARNALEQIPLAQASLQAEAEVLKRRLPGVRALAQNLKTLFPNPES